MAILDSRLFRVFIARDIFVIEAIFVVTVRHAHNFTVTPEQRVKMTKDIDRPGSIRAVEN